MSVGQCQVIPESDPHGVPPGRMLKTYSGSMGSDWLPTPAKRNAARKPNLKPAA